MRVHLLAVGRLKAGPERDLAARYVDRFAKMGPPLGLEFGRLVEIAESRAGNAETRKREEAEGLMKALPDGCGLVLLDERGRMETSDEFARTMAQWRDGGRRDMAVAIGGADGHGEEIRSAAERVVSFGRMTWPHQLVRIMACEQLYRAATILAGHPYHRG